VWFISWALVIVIGAVGAVILAMQISDWIQTTSLRDIGFIVLIVLIGVVVELRKLRRKVADADARNARSGSSVDTQR
jgi:hypothetical protein